MGTPLGLLLQAELDRRGWSSAELARRTDMGRGQISKLVNGTIGEPDLNTLDRIARALDIPLLRLVQALGYPVNHTHEDRDARVSILLDRVPQLRSMLDDLMRMSPEDLDAMQAYVDGRLRRQERHR